MRQLVIKGNLALPDLSVSNGNFIAFSDLSNVNTEAIVIEGDVRISLPQDIDYELLVTGDIACREV